MLGNACDIMISMLPIHVPTMLQQHLYHVFNICVALVLFAPVVIVYLHKTKSKHAPKRRTAIAIELVLELVFFVVFVVNVLVGLSSGMSIEYLFEGMNLLNALLYVWIVLSLGGLGMTYQLYRMYSKQELQAHIETHENLHKS